MKNKLTTIVKYLIVEFQQNKCKLTINFPYMPDHKPINIKMPVIT